MEQKQGKVLPDAEVPEGFSVTLALEDAVPVVLLASCLWQSASSCSAMQQVR